MDVVAMRQKLKDIQARAQAAVAKQNLLQEEVDRLEKQATDAGFDVNDLEGTIARIEAEVTEVVAGVETRLDALKL
jgi:uncharacterized protein YlxW (UPF0749 family)